MNDRTQALDLLRRARDILAERVTERVLANKDEILADALGLAHESEIDGLYEQLGVRLAHVNHLLSHLPAEEAAPGGEDDAIELNEQPRAAAEETSRSAELAARDHAHRTAAGPHLALPAPGEMLQLPGPAPAVSFQRFATRIFVGDLDGAGEVLADLFELEAPRARRCAQVFYDGVRHNPTVIGKAAQLRRNLQGGDYAGAMSLLHDCFGLQGIESISVMQTLRARLERSA
ncbi:MAG: hypothetical protein KDA41_01320 [Planctomycetales bacterium]|nr:hypothetical protein [Planctomycetales bacterium]